jgi:hypothetical protein
MRGRTMDIAKRLEQLARPAITGMGIRDQDDKRLELLHRLQSLPSVTKRIEGMATPTRLVRIRALHAHQLHLLLDTGTRAPDRDHDWTINIRMLPSHRDRLDPEERSVTLKDTPSRLADSLLLQSIPELDHRPTSLCPGRRNFRRKPDLGRLQLSEHLMMTEGPGRNVHRQSKSIRRTLLRFEAQTRTSNKCQTQGPNTRTSPNPDGIVPCNLLPLVPKCTICPRGQSDSQQTTMDTNTRIPLVLPIQTPDHLSARCP